MRLFSWLNLSVSSLVWLVVLVEAGKTPIRSVQVTLRGKKYDIEDVTTVSELQQRLADQSGVDPSQQGRVLFNGKRLDASESLSEAGVSAGAQLNVVPGKTKSKTASASSSASIATDTSSSAASTSSTSDYINDLLQKSGIDKDQLDEMVKNMGGGDGEGPSLKESMEMMSSMMNSPIFQEYMHDPERLEQSRQMIVKNPMLKSMMASMPGMEDLLNDPDAWREAMQAAASLYSNMDQDELMQAMMGGASGLPPPGGLFDSVDTSKPDLAALDELSEGED